MSGVDPEITLHQDGPFCYRATMNYTSDTLDEMAHRVAERIENELTQQIIERLGYVKPVRCRDCENCEQHYTDGVLFDETVCWAWDNGHDYPHYTSPDGFCHRGERKEGK